VTEHARYGGSTIDRTITCPAWRSFADTLPKQGSSQFADRGTLLHDAMHTIYTKHEDESQQASVIGMTYEGIELTRDLYETKIIPAVEAVEEIFNEYNVENYVCETKVVLSEDVWGTADILARGEIMLPPEGNEDFKPIKCKVGLSLDHKFGDGILVFAENNKQGLFYALCASLTPATMKLFEDIDILIVGIIQPNERGLPNYSLWTVDPQEMRDFQGIVEKAVAAAEGKDPEFKVSDACTFCPGKGLCPPTSGELQHLLRVDVKAPEVLKRLPTFEELERMDASLKALRTFIHEQLELGVTVPSYKLVPKRASRVYTDQAAAEEVAKRTRKLKRDEVYDFEFKSPPQLEKVCKAKDLSYEEMFGPFIAKRSSGTTLASVDDKRDAVPGIEGLKLLLNQGGPVRQDKPDKKDKDKKPKAKTKRKGKKK